MKNKKRIIIVLLLLLLTTGCTKQLTDSNNKPVKNEKTGQTLTENIICKPKNKDTYNIYKENNVKIYLRHNFIFSSKVYFSGRSVPFRVYINLYLKIGL